MRPQPFWFHGRGSQKVLPTAWDRPPHPLSGPGASGSASARERGQTGQGIDPQCPQLSWISAGAPGASLLPRGLTPPSAQHSGWAQLSVTRHGSPCLAGRPTRERSPVEGWKVGTGLIGPPPRPPSVMLSISLENQSSSPAHKKNGSIGPIDVQRLLSQE